MSRFPQSERGLLAAFLLTSCLVAQAGKPVVTVPKSSHGTAWPRSSDAAKGSAGQSKASPSRAKTSEASATRAAARVPASQGPAKQGSVSQRPAKHGPASQGPAKQGSVSQRPAKHGPAKNARAGESANAPQAGQASKITGKASGSSTGGESTTQGRQVDVVQMQNGNLLEGRVLAETETSLSIRIGPGQVVEIPKRLVARFTRRSAPGAKAKANSPRWHTRKAFFRLRNAEGRLVGKMHYYVRAEAQAQRLEQQWTFVDGGTRTLIHRIETSDRELNPLSFQYRETSFRRSDKHQTRELLVRGKVIGDRLQLESVGPKGRERRTIPFPKGNSFPMLIEEQLRRGEVKGAHSYSASVYDPLEAVFELRRWRLEERVPAPRSAFAKTAQSRSARLIECTVSGRRQREWISSTGRIALLEVNGVHLVGEPISEATANALEAFEKERALPTFKQFGGLELWVPNATWSFGHEPQRGRVLQLVTPFEGAKVAVKFLKTEDKTILEVAEDYLRRFRLENPWFVQQSYDVSARGENERETAQVEGVGRRGENLGRQAKIIIRGTPSGFLVFEAFGKGKTWKRLARELDEFVDASREIQAEMAGPGR